MSKIDYVLPSILALALSATVSIADDSNYGHSHGAGMAADFSGWEGTWQSIDDLVADDAMLPLAQTVSSQVHGWTTSDVRNWLVDIRRDNFGAVRVEGDAITYLEDDAQTVICEARYETVDGPAIPNGPRGEVPILRGKMANSEGYCYPFEYIAMIVVHGEPAGWHLRYGAEGFEPLEVDAWGGWWASLTPMDITAERYAARLESVSHFLVDQLNTIEPRRGWEAQPYN